MDQSFDRETTSSIMAISSYISSKDLGLEVEEEEEDEEDGSESLFSDELLEVCEESDEDLEIGAAAGVSLLWALLLLIS